LDSRIVANSAFVMAAATDKITANKKMGERTLAQ
jgi:hypothetical protein